MLLQKTITELVPPATAEPHKELDETRTCETVAEAKELFTQAAQKLRQPHLWKPMTGLVGATFSAHYAGGKAFEGTVSRGDLLKIDIGGLLPLGHDWVEVEQVVSRTDGDEEVVAVQVHPCAPSDTQGTTHFFDAKATSTWIVGRQGTRVSAHYRGRREVANEEGKGIVRQLRDKLVAGAAVLGLADIQWSALLKGLLEKD